MFLDANVLFSAAYREGSGLSRLWLLADIELLSSNYAIAEAERNLATDAQRKRLTDLLASVTNIGDAPLLALPPGVVLPDKDVPILSAAIHANATHLLTGDKTHFGALFGQVTSGVLIVPPAAYIASRGDATQNALNES
jgi:predicted nucleic acid-binding protein